ncbi:MAG TPA: (2Fe-2S)-binding protein [Candidatus Dormibacteraeota bacterium]|nr:(2Fe-2S)-binding protein [Candidatus Dormibacteraeota bacterium]
MDDQADRPTVEPASAPDGAASGGDGSRRAKIAGGVGAAAVVAVGAAVGITELVRSRQAAIPKGSILVNGGLHQVQSAPDTPLLYVLRDELGLHGPRFGCGLGQCGACAVLVGGKETRSCVTGWTTLTEEVTTLEGLPARWAAQKGLSAAQAAVTLHPVQQAWIDQQVPQCGYCQSGMMIMAVDLLGRNASPTEAQIKDAFTNTPPSPHLCRCGTYRSIIAAVQRASKAMA